LLSQTFSIFRVQFNRHARRDQSLPSSLVDEFRHLANRYYFAAQIHPNCSKSWCSSDQLVRILAKGLMPFSSSRPHERHDSAGKTTFGQAEKLMMLPGVENH
jgi:hypothetical protein